MGVTSSWKGCALCMCYRFGALHVCVDLQIKTVCCCNAILIDLLDLCHTPIGLVQVHFVSLKPIDGMQLVETERLLKEVSRFNHFH